MNFFDCFATIGPRQKMGRSEQYSLKHLLKSMDRCGVDAALVGSTFSVKYDPMWGNRWLCEQIKGSKRLFPVWTALPHQTGEFPSTGRFVKEATAANVRAVRLYPKTQKYFPDKHTLGSLMRALDRAGMTVFIHRDEFVSADSDAVEGFARLKKFLSMYAANRIVFLGSHWRDVRCVMSLMKQCANLHIELSSFQANMIVEEMTPMFGSSRLLFGSNAPGSSPGAARSMIDWAGIPKHDRRQMASRNLMRLLGVRSLPRVVKKPSDDIMSAAWQGKPLDMIQVIDAHAHFNHERCNGVGDVTQFHGDVKGIKRLFLRLGIRRSAMSPWLGIMGPAPRMGNDLTYKAMRAEPDFVIGYACIDPVLMTKAEIEKEIQLRHIKQGFAGLKPYQMSGAAYDDPGYRPWYSLADQLCLFALFHGGAEIAARLAGKYKNISFLLAHSGQSINLAHQRALIAKTSRHIYCEITHTNVTNGVIELMVRELGANRVVLGTDTPMRDPRPQLGWVVHADISRAAKAKVLGGNFARILAGRAKPELDT